MVNSLSILVHDSDQLNAPCNTRRAISGFDRIIPLATHSVQIKKTNLNVLYLYGTIRVYVMADDLLVCRKRAALNVIW